MQDFVRDWRRWRVEERIIAALVFGFVIGAPFVPLVVAIVTYRR
jgi:hypothetical protein